MLGKIHVLLSLLCLIVALSTSLLATDLDALPLVLVTHLGVPQMAPTQKTLWVCQQVMLLWLRFPLLSLRLTYWALIGYLFVCFVFIFSFAWKMCLEFRMLLASCLVLALSIHPSHGWPFLSSSNARSQFSGPNLGVCSPGWWTSGEGQLDRYKQSQAGWGANEVIGYGDFTNSLSLMHNPPFLETTTQTHCLQDTNFISHSQDLCSEIISIAQSKVYTDKAILFSFGSDIRRNYRGRACAGSLYASAWQHNGVPRYLFKHGSRYFCEGIPGWDEHFNWQTE